MSGSAKASAQWTGIGLLAAGILLALCALLRFGLSSLRDSAALTALQPRHSLELLLVGDPFAVILEKSAPQLQQQLGIPVKPHIRRYARTLEEILMNARDTHSYYHLVSFDVLWLPMLVESGVLSPLDAADMANIGRNPQLDFHPITLTVNRYGGQLYGIPIQPHFEVLWYRKDLLASAGLSAPRTLDELLQMARYFHRPEQDFYGICWNALRGQALGQTVAHMYAAFGQGILDSNARPQIDTPTGKAVLEYLLQLMEVSPPDILTMAWDQRIDRFSRGYAAFTYGWTGRAGMVETHPLSRVRGNVGYAPAPGLRPDLPGSAFGQWSMGIPANLDPVSRALAIEGLRLLSSDAVHQIFAQDGVLGHHRRFPAPADLSAPVSVVDELLEAGFFSLEARPAVAIWTDMAEITGTLFHDVLQGKRSIAEALALAQSRAVKLRDAGAIANP